MVRSRAPFRVSFSGGGTDVPPYPELFGGVVLSSTIRKYAYCTVLPHNTEGLLIRESHAEVSNGVDTVGGETVNGETRLVEAVARRIGVCDGLEVRMTCDCLPGSGLGSSSAAVVAVIGALSDWTSRPIRKEEVAQLAYQVERSDVGIPGGIQDQYAAAMGGFNFMEFTSDGVRVKRLPIPRDIVNELEYRLLLCSTGITRASGGILARQIQSYKSGMKEVLEALHEIKRLTYEFEKRLVQGNLEEFGYLLGQEWELKKKLDGAISNNQVDKLYSIALENGAMGGKLLGAGGGGYLLLFSKEGSRGKLASAMAKYDCRPDGIRFEEHGLETWKVNNGVTALNNQNGGRNHLPEWQPENRRII